MALAIHPNFPSAWYNKGNAYANLGRLQDAIACYRETLQLDDKDVPSWHNLGNAYEELGRI